MNAERGVHGGRVEHAVPDHRLRPIRGLLGGLERELHAARQKCRVQPARDLEPDRDMPVMAAGVHLARVLGAVGDVVRFIYRERGAGSGTLRAPEGTAPRSLLPEVSYPRARTVPVDNTDLAFRPPGDAHAAPVLDQGV